MKLPRRSLIVYAAALVGVGIATAIRSALDPVLGEHVMFSIYFLAVSVAAWSGGIRPAMITAILSSFLANYLFSNPRGYLEIDNAEQVCALTIFLCVSLLIGVLCEVSLKSLERARAAERQKDDFLAILAHELRNPLAIIHYTNVAEQRGSEQFDQERSEVIDRQVQRLDQMIEDLIDISRISRGKFRLEFEPISVAAIVEDVLKRVQHLIADRDHEFVVDRRADDLILSGDPLRLQQILTNLLRNAARSTPRGGKIELQALPVNGHVVFRVRDNGQGISKDILGRIFDLHTQVERALERSGSDLGVGLALVRTLVELHGGTITASSDGPDRGSEFVVRLPLHRGQNALGASPREVS